MKFYTTSKISENIHETPEGFLVCIGVPIARTGEMVYGEGETPLETDDEGKILIHREEAEVFRPETMASFEGKAVTITHPVDFVSPENWSRLAKGVLQNVRRGEGENKNDLIADLLITDSVAINLVKNGLREVSCGYEAEYTQTGEGRGLQTNIVGNHLALVDEGRAGSSYAINDHKGKVPMKLKDKIKAIFAKAQDEAMAMADAEEKPAPEKKDDKEKAKDESAGAMDELKKMVSDLGEKIAAMGEKKPKDSAEEKPAPEKKDDAKDDESEDEESEGEKSLEDRMKALETAVAKLLEKQAPASDEEGEEGDESEDADGDEDESEDDDFEESTMTGDTASRVEILAPGMNAKAKDAKSKALVAAYATKDGKAVIDQLTGGKAPELKDAKRVDVLFIAASELLKVSRTSDLSKTKQSRATDSSSETPKGAMTAEQLNAINAKHYGIK